MSSTLKTNKQKLEQMKKRRQQRNRATNQSQVSQTNPSQINQVKRQFSLQKSQTVHVTGALVETYDMQIQCALETRSLDSKAHREIEQQQKQIDLLQPKQQQKRRKQNQKDDLQIKQVHQLNQEELQSLIKSKHFNDFFNKSSKFLQKVLDHGNGDMLELILRDGFKSKQIDQHDTLSLGITFNDHNYTLNRVVTDLDWSPQISDLLLASYSQNQQGSIKDHVGVALLWNPALKNRPEFYCFCQSAITSAKFFPFSNNTVLGGCYNGQLLLWDIRVKSMPVQRSGISADAHKYPVNSLSVIGTQIANNIASFSNDGMMCLWDIKQFSKPIRTNRISAARPLKATNKTTTTGLAPSVLNRSSRLQQLSTSTALDRTRQQPHQISVTCCEFPKGDANNYYIGSLNGAMYKNALHNRATDNITMYDDHIGPISALSVNYSPEYEFLNGLILTASYDWTVKLWGPHNNKDPLKTFQSSEDFIYDIKWNPSNPSLFASVNNQGYVDLFDLTKDLQLPIAHKKVNNFAQNKMAWNQDGSALVTGDSAGGVNLLVLSQKYRKMDSTKAQNLRNVLATSYSTEE